MINKFEKQLEKWNGGVLRGAQAKLARYLHVSTATVALWATGKRRPSKGYAAQMAQLFGLDSYDVMRLFPATTTYPDLASERATQSLRDAQAPENTYSADNLHLKTPPAAARSNSVSLPVLMGAPENYPLYKEEDVAEWWTLPLRYAKGAKYLVQLGHEAPHHLYFIRPETNLIEGKWMLFKTPKGYTVKKGFQKEGSICLCSAEGKEEETYSPGQITPLGCVVCKVTDTE